MAPIDQNIVNDIDDSLTIDCYKCNKLEDCKNRLNEFPFRTVTYNIRSIQKNLHAFIVALERLKLDIDVIILTECWLSMGTVIPQIPGYRTYHTVLTNNRAGGVVAYVRNDICATVEEPNLPDADCLRVTLPNATTIIGIYRSPSFANTKNFITGLSELLEPIHNSRVIVTGDININILDCLDPSVNEYSCLMAELGFLPAITKPTRLDACLDHFFIRSRADRVAGLVAALAISDHDLVILGLAIPNTKPSRNRYKIITDHSAVVGDLGAADWAPVMLAVDVEVAVTEFNHILTTIISNNTSTKRLSRSTLVLKPWITKGLLRCMVHRDKLHLDLRQHPDDPIRKRVYNRYRNFLTDLLHSLKQDYERRELAGNRNNPKNLWKTIKTIIESPPSRESSAFLLNARPSAKESVSYCNDYYANVGKNLSDRLLNNLSTSEESLAAQYKTLGSTHHNLFLQPTDIFEVSALISQLKLDSAPGSDGIKPSIIKDACSEIVVPLTHIYNLSLSSGTFPKSWKVAVLIPIHKSGPKTLPENYRPISLLPIFSKILERIVNTRLMKYLEKFHLLSDRQFGFRGGLSTEDAVGLLVGLVSKSMDKGQKSLGVFLDLAKAFDTISVPLLLKKLELFGIRGIVLDWFRSYLTDRFQQVRICDHLSEQLPVVFGVPQGSVLGPTLFVMYINDIHDIKGPELICYADDTVAVFHGDTWSEALASAESGMSSLKEWLDSNLLTLNLCKTKYLCFHKTAASKPLAPTELKIHNCTSSCSCYSIDRSEHIRYLGVQIDDRLSFRQHIAWQITKTRRLTHIMRLLSKSADKPTLTSVYIALCQSVLGYCISVWGGVGVSTMLGLERAQRSILKVMLRRHRRHPTIDLYSEAQVLNVRQIYFLKVFLMAHKSTISSPNYSVLLQKRVFRIPTNSVKTAFAGNHLAFKLPLIYNRITGAIPEIKTCRIYKAKVLLTNWLLKLSYQDTENILKIIG